MKKRCWICGCLSRQVEATLRGGAPCVINHCGSCDFDFIDRDNQELLSRNQLDESRLEKAGLKIPAIDQDFHNGLRQSESYVRDFLSQKDSSKNILEVGCSWGYFLKVAKKKGLNPFGLEINPVRAHYVSARLGIPCFQTIAELESAPVAFRKIFMFYSIQYIAQPKSFLNRLLRLLEDGGQLVLITPNLHDVLKDVWKNVGFQGFFYDEVSVAYYSERALERLLKNLDANVDVHIQTEQGYSLVNHFGWFLTGQPRTTGIVGGDSFVPTISRTLSSSHHKLGKELALMVERWDRQYRRCIESFHCGNRLIGIITKKSSPTAPKGRGLIASKRLQGQRG